MKKLFAVIAIAVFSISGIALAQYGPHGVYVATPNCFFNWNCAKVLGNKTACSCINPSNNSEQDYIYSPAQINAINNQIGVQNNLVNIIDNAV